MNRPFRRWCGVVVVLGILAGCGKKPAETVSGNNDPGPNSADRSKSESMAAKQRERGPKAEQPESANNNNEKFNLDWVANLPTTVPAKKAEEPESNATTQVKGAEAVTSTAKAGTGTIEVTRCKFDGVEKAIADAKGKVVLIDCWATWCPPCVASFPKLVEKHQKYASKGLAVISLSTDKVADAPKVLPFLQKMNASFTNLHMPLDAAGQKGLQEKFEYRNAIPHAVLFDKTGKRVWSGHPMDPKLTALIEAELAKSGPIRG